MWSSPLFPMRMCLARRKMGRLESAITSFPKKNKQNQASPDLSPLIFNQWGCFPTLILVLKEQKDDYWHGMWWNSPIKYSTLRATLRWTVFWFKPVKTLVKLCLHHDGRKSSWHFNVVEMFERVLLGRSTSVEDLDGMDGRGWGEDDFAAVTDGDSVSFIVTGCPGL